MSALDAFVRSHTLSSDGMNIQHTLKFLLFALSHSCFLQCLSVKMISDISYTVNACDRIFYAGVSIYASIDAPTTHQIFTWSANFVSVLLQLAAFAKQTWASHIFACIFLFLGKTKFICTVIYLYIGSKHFLCGWCVDTSNSLGHVHLVFILLKARVNVNVNADRAHTQRARTHMHTHWMNGATLHT